jgi:NAD(P)-dependent dehydrogenase (short-subunit alcohol dehydrogenase family)
MWDAAIQVNLMSAVRLDRALLPAMVERGAGAIVHITSIQRRLPLFESRSVPGLHRRAPTNRLHC